jgi:hypothetical protein
METKPALDRAVERRLSWILLGLCALLGLLLALCL